MNQFLCAIACGLLFTTPIFGGKSKHNPFTITNHCNQAITVKISSQYLQTNPDRKHQSKEVQPNETKNFPILKTHDIAEIKIIYANGKRREKKNFKKMDSGYDDHYNKNSHVTTGSMDVYEDKAVIHSKKKNGKTVDLTF